MRNDGAVENLEVACCYARIGRDGPALRIQPDSIPMYIVHRLIVIDSGALRFRKVYEWAPSVNEPRVFGDPNGLFVGS